MINKEETSNGLVLHPRNGLSLCAGAGGLDMGLMLAEPDFHTRCFVEWEEYPREALIAAQRAGYFAPAPIWDDVTTFDAKSLAGAIDTILAGYPCQPFSQAGQRKGEADERHLWPDIERIIGELGPTLRWCFFENVAGHLTLGLKAVVRSLHGMGFRVAVGVFSAGEVGATHERQRVFIVAYREGERTGEPHDTERTIARGDARRSVGGSGLRSDGEMADPDGGHTAPGSGGELADSDNTGSQGQQQNQLDPQGREVEARHARLRCGAGLFPPGPGDHPAWASVLGMAPDLAPAVAFGDIARRADQLAAMVASGQLAEAEAEPDLRGMVDGLAQRPRALRLLGNGVVPLAAAYAWRSLSAAHGLGWLDLGAASREYPSGK